MRRTMILSMVAVVGGCLMAGIIASLAGALYLWYMNPLAGTPLAALLFLVGISKVRALRGEVELDLEDIRAWKVANIDAKGVFHGVFHGEYTTDDVSVCRRTKQDHSPPELGCTCGFYAFKRRMKALEMWEDTLATALLEVDLYGTIIEHERGFRAQSQAVLALHLPTRCRHCLRRADGVSMGADSYYEVACGRCRNRRGGLTSTELAALLGTEVHHSLRWNLLPPRKSRREDT